MLCLVSYDLRIPDRDYSALYAAIQGVGPALRVLQSVWLVQTTQSLTNVRALLQANIHENDSLLVVDVTGMQYDGWLPARCWEWYRSHNG